VVSAPDENTIDQTLASLRAYSPETLADIGQINTHTYNGSQRAELKAFAEAHGKRLWVSEYGDGDSSGLPMAATIIADLKQMGAAGWVYWQAVDWGGWGLLENGLQGPTATSYVLGEKYYILGQFSRYVRPGDYLLQVDGDINTLATYRPGDDSLTFVTLNPGKDTAQLTYDLTKCGRLPKKIEATRTSDRERWLEIPSPTVSGYEFKTTAPAKSVTTFVVTFSANEADSAAGDTAANQASVSQFQRQR
jgi:O-glycosyl hydrolase